MCSVNAKISSALLAVTLVLTACGGGGASTTGSAPTATIVPSIQSSGKDFYLTLPDHICVSSPSLCNSGTTVTNKLIIASSSAATGNITFNGITTSFSVAAGSETAVTLDPAVVLTANETVEPKGIHVTSSVPVSVHVVSENATSADGYLALPVSGLGADYFVMSYGSTRYTGSEFAVVATQNNTLVTITPTASGITQLAGMTYTVTLNAGDTYQLANPSNADMTGTHITANLPIAVFSGHRCADVPSGIGYCDYLVEQLPDTTVWGNTFHTTTFSGRARYTVRILAAQNGTTITTQPAGLIPGTLNAGQFVDVDLSGTGEFVSNNPVLIAQFMRGYADDMAAKGDPSMVLVTPSEMGVLDATFGVEGLAGSAGSYMNVVTETAALSSLTLDNTAVDPGLFTSVGGTSIYSVGTIPVSAGAHTLAGSAVFSALVYDYGIASNAVSYAYPVATALSVPVATAGATTGTSTTPSTGCSGVEGNVQTRNHHHDGSSRESDNDEDECH